MMVCDLQGHSLKDNVASALPSFESLIQEEASCHVMRMLKQSSGEVHVERSRGLQPTATGVSPSLWKQAPPAPGKPSDDNGSNQHPECYSGETPR